MFHSRYGATLPVLLLEMLPAPCGRHRRQETRTGSHDTYDMDVCTIASAAAVAIDLSYTGTAAVPATGVCCCIWESRMDSSFTQQTQNKLRKHTI